MSDPSVYVVFGVPGNGFGVQVLLLGHASGSAQIFQNPSVKEGSLNHLLILMRIVGTFLT